MISIIKSAVCSVRCCFILLACLVLLASCSPASAQTFHDPQIFAQKVTMGGVPKYYIKGTTTAIDIPKGSGTVHFKFEFKRQNQFGEYVTELTAETNLTPVDGKAAYDTGFLPVTAQQGENWRGTVSGYYIDAMKNKMNIPDGISNILPMP